MRTGIIKLLIAVFLLVVVQLSAAPVILKGRVLDKKTASPLPYAHVYLKHTAKGTTTNEQGYFSFQYSTSEEDTIMVTYLGYKAGMLSGKELLQNKSLDIFLEEASIQVNEISITSYSPAGLLKEALASFRQNYFTTPTLQSAELKQYAKMNNQYLRFLDASVNIWSPSYMKDDMASGRVELLSGKVSSTDMMPDKNIHGIKLFVSELSPDAFLGALYENLDKMKIQLHIEGMIQAEGREAFKLTAESDNLIIDQPSHTKFVFYIDKLSKAVVSYKVMQDREEPRTAIISNKDSVIYRDHAYVIGYVNYRPLNGKWIVADAQFRLDLAYSVTGRKDHKEKDRLLVHNWLVLVPGDTRYENVERPRKSKCLDLSRDLYDQVPVRDDQIWKGLDNALVTAEELEFLENKEFKK